MTPLVAVISPLRPILVPNTAAPSNWARGRLWIHYQARIQYRVHAWDPHLTLIIDFDFDNRCHVGQETAVRRNPDTSALTVVPLPSSRFFRHHFRDSAQPTGFPRIDRKSTRLNSSHVAISYAVFCLKKKKK